MNPKNPTAIVQASAGHVLVAAVLPRYEWQEGKRNGRDVLLETKVGYRMQSNLHLAVPDDATAQAALSLAFEKGVTDIIAFDFTHTGNRDRLH